MKVLAGRRPIYPYAILKGTSATAWNEGQCFCKACTKETIMVLLELSLTPLGKGESVSPFVARCLNIIDESGLDYRVHAMGTVIEGDIDQVLGVLKQCFEAMAADCDRVVCSAKLDYRKGYRGRLASKVESVEKKLGRRLKK